MNQGSLEFVSNKKCFFVIPTYSTAQLKHLSNPQFLPTQLYFKLPKVPLRTLRVIFHSPHRYNTGTKSISTNHSPWNQIQQWLPRSARDFPGELWRQKICWTKPMSSGLPGLRSSISISFRHVQSPFNILPWMIFSLNAALLLPHPYNQFGQVSSLEWFLTTV